MAKVLYAKLNNTEFVPGLGEIPAVLPPPNKTWDLDMKTTDIGLLLIVQSKGKPFNVLLPYSKVGAMSLEVEKVSKVNAA